MIGYSYLPQPIAKPLPKLTGHPKRGRPLIEERGKTLAAIKPWLALGITRRAWYYRQAKDKDSKL
jgi:hypothetical protein